MYDRSRFQWTGGYVGRCGTGELETQWAVTAPRQNLWAAGVKGHAAVQHRHAPVSKEAGEPFVRHPLNVGDTRVPGTEQASGEMFSVLF